MNRKADHTFDEQDTSTWAQEAKDILAIQKKYHQHEDGIVDYLNLLTDATENEELSIFMACSMILNCDQELEALSDYHQSFENLAIVWPIRRAGNLLICLRRLSRNELTVLVKNRDMWQNTWDAFKIFANAYRVITSTGTTPPTVSPNGDDIAVVRHGLHMSLGMLGPEGVDSAFDPEATQFIRKTRKIDLTSPPMPLPWTQDE